MHIPDGYLSPSTCAVTFAVAVPVWSVALKRVERLMRTRTVPLLALVSAFCFVVMMFNLPLPGGTSGHAVGMGIAAIVLGPWASMIAISVALLIQAVFFGDGGITTFAANSLNMAIVGSLAAYWIYRGLAGRAALGSRRRVVAAATAGYIAINVSALLAAVELGIQPMLFHTAAGTPLYAPYPLSVAVPAMMIGHLTFAGIAELVITGGLVAYLQRSHPELLRRSAPLAANDAAPSRLAATGSWRTTCTLWLWLAGLMVLTPLGLLAAGVAWGEWGVADFTNPALRQQIIHASGNVAPPAAAPHGLARLAHLWTAPIPDYAPSFMHSASFGYVMSALMGTGLILLLFVLISRLLNRRASLPDAH